LSFQTAQPVQPRKLANISGQDTASNQEAVIVPYASGTGKIALLWLNDFYNITPVDTSTGGGKKGVGDTSQRNYYGDIGGLVCVCPDDAPVDKLLNVFVNDEAAYRGPLTRTPGQHYASFTIPDFCQECRIYWGTKDQPIDDLIFFPRQASVPPGVDPRDVSTWPALDENGNPWGGGGSVPGVPNPYGGHYDYHPAYRNQCYIVFKQFLLGASVNQPNVEVSIARGYKFFGGVTFATDIDGVNPMGPLYEIATDDMFGAGMSEFDLDEVGFQTAWRYLDGLKYKLAPVLREPKSFRAFLADYLEYFDGFGRRIGDLFSVGVFDHGDIDQSGLLELGSNDVAGDEPQITPTTLEDTKNHFEVVYTDRDKWWTDGTESFRHTANFMMTGEKRPDRQQRPFFNDSAQAARYVTHRGLMLGSVSGGSGSTAFLRDKVRDVLPGDRFKLDSASFGLTMLMRVTAKEISAPGSGTTKLSYIVELADWDHPYQQPPAPQPPGFTIQAFVIEFQRIVELPSPLKDAPGIQVAILAERPSPHIIGFGRTSVATTSLTTRS
jgi:hypothetical protein